jgi:hypothetical protein
MPAATGYTLTPPSPAASAIGVASGNFTVTPSGTYTGTITPAAAGGTFTPAALTWAGDAAPKTFTYTPAAGGAHTITCTSAPALADPVGVDYATTIPIAVTNAEWSVLSDVKQALVDVQVSATAVFAKVSIAATRRKADQTLFVASPLAVVQYLGTDEYTPDDTRLGLVIRMELLLGSKASTTEEARVQEALRLVNAAKNAVDTRPPTICCAFGAGGALHYQVQWGQPVIEETESKDPWAVVRLPLMVAVPLAGSTSR